MSVRVYSGQHSDRRRRQGGVLRFIPVLLALATIGLDIAYPLVHGVHRRDVVVATVVCFFLASALHALIWRGFLWTLGMLVVTVGGGLAVEAAGIRTGVPFGDYTYGANLTKTVLGVPWVIPLAWAMMAYPALIAARRISRSRLFTPFIGALALAGWDLFLDPMMTGERYWTFTHPSPALPHVPGIPVANFAGWFLVGLAMMALLDRLDRRPAPDAVPSVLFLWTYVSSVVGALFFFHRPWVALYGGVVMGLVALPFAWALWTGRD